MVNYKMSRKSMNCKFTAAAYTGLKLNYKSYAAFIYSTVLGNLDPAVNKHLETLTVSQKKNMFKLA